MENQFEISGPLCEYNNQKSKSGKERFFSLENNKLNCYRKKKEMIDSKEPKYSLDMQACKDVKLQKSRHDNILCIEHDARIVFLIAPRKEDINKWYNALSRLCNYPDNNCNDYEEPRRRLGTEPNLRPNNTRGRDLTTRQPITSPGSLNGFMNITIEKEAQRRPLPSLPEDQANIAHTSEANANNINIHVLTDLPCCIRHHSVQYHQDGRNMVDTGTLYENIHFIRNEKEWRQKTEDNKHKLQVNKDCYNLANKIKGLQEHSESDIEGQGEIEQLSQSNNEEPIYMNTPKPPSNIKPRIPVEDEFPRPVPGDNKTPPPLPRKVATTQPPLSVLRPRPTVPEKRNRKGPTTAPKPAPKPRKEETSDNPCPLRSFVCPDTNCLTRNSDYSVGDLVRQQGKGSVTVNIPKQVLTDNKIKLAEINDGIWFGGFEHNCPEDRQWLLFGDQLVQINDQWLNSAEFADNIIKTASKQVVSLCVKRLPHAQIITIHREYEHQILGLECRRREITKVIPDEIASTQGRLRPEATGISGMICTWTITHINSDPIPPNITTEMMEEKLKMAGTTVHLIVQPTDFVQEITNAFRNAQSC